MFCKSLGWAGGANHKLVFKEVKKNFLALVLKQVLTKKQNKWFLSV